MTERLIINELATVARHAMQVLGRLCSEEANSVHAALQGAVALADSLPTQNMRQALCERFTLDISLDHAKQGMHTGDCEADVEALLTLPYIAVQLNAIAPAALADELREYGSWSEEELADHEQNRKRILWLACGDIVEEEGYPDD